MLNKSLFAVAILLFNIVVPLAAAELPNVILILADDLGYADLSLTGSKYCQTPNIDQLAHEGTFFRNFVVSQPVCTASRASLMSGCYANRVGLSGALNHTSKIGLNPSEVTIAELFKSRGYATACLGKWHLGQQQELLPTSQGFDLFEGLPYSNDNGPLHPIVKDIPALPWFTNDKITEHDPDQATFSQRLTDSAIEFMQTNRDKPFFLYIPHVMPHVPIFASADFKGKSGQGLYADVVAELDFHIGRLLKSIDNLHLRQKTLVLFTSDNGPFLSYGNHAGLATPYREGKLTVFEGGVRLPLLARYPGFIPAGKVSDDFLASIDLYPTLATLIGAKLPEYKIDGQNVWGAITGKDPSQARQTFFYYSGKELHAVRKGNWKLHVAHEYLTVAGPAGVNGKPANYANMKPNSITESGIKGIASRHGYRVESLPQSLFNLITDPGEINDVSTAHPTIVSDLLKLAEQARADLGDDLLKIPGKNIRPVGMVK